MSKSTSKSDDSKEKDQDGDLDHHPEDLAALDVFCNEVEYDEIAFDSWGDHHESLDLVLYLKVSAEEANQGGERELKYSQTLKIQKQGKLIISRQKASVVICWSTMVSEGFEFCFPGLGDTSGAQTGDLRVQIKIYKKVYK